MKLPSKLLIGSIILALSLAAPDSFADIDDLLSPEAGDRDFERFEIGDLIVFWHQRTIDGAILEKDQIVYQFDAETGRLIDKKMNWREDMPDHVVIGITAEGAEAIAGGDPISSTLYFISPESDVYTVDPAPQNPCWIVRTMKNDDMEILIIDATTGELLGQGIPPPFFSFSFSGPIYDYPCQESWDNWYQNAEYWFNVLGYNCQGFIWPPRENIRNHLQNSTTGMFYEIAHGGSDIFANGCNEWNNFEFTTAGDIDSWIAAYPKMRFAFIASCDGMCQTGDGTFSYEFRKGDITYTATVGYCGMSADYCTLCWEYSVSWQDALFYYMSLGWTVKDAFDQAQADYPACAGSNNCMRFAGDPNFSGPYFRSECSYVVGDVNGSNSFNGLDITYGINFFKGGNEPMCEECPLCSGWWYCGDVNASCSYNGVDITYGVAYLKGGAAPIPCPSCPPFN
jgi:hypothetical protein